MLIWLRKHYSCHLNYEKYPVIRQELAVSGWPVLSKTSMQLFIVDLKKCNCFIVEM